jgi:hypothetical protein
MCDFINVKPDRLYIYEHMTKGIGKNINLPANKKWVALG